MRSVDFPVTLHQNSLDYLKRVQSRYEQKPLAEGQYSITTRGRTILHMYPSRDTHNVEDGYLEGFKDALFFNLEVFDVEEGVYWRSNREHDGIHFDEVTPHDFKIFKDGSPIVRFAEPIEVVLHQCIEIESAQ